MATTKITSPDLFNLESLNTALKLPSGTTAQRPTSPSTGEWRYNTTTNLVEFWDGGAWRDLQSEVIPPIPSENFNVVIWNGDGNDNRAIEVGFQPDMVWYKTRNQSNDHNLSDSTRGAAKQVRPNRDIAEVSATDQIKSFTSTGFTVGTGADANSSGNTYVAWCWKANGGTTSSNTDGTITSTVQANTKAGFSVVKYTGNNVAGATIGHGLASAPDMIIVKNLDTTDNWTIQLSPLGYTYYIDLNNTNAATVNSGVWYAAPTSSVFSFGANSRGNGNGNNIIAYCFNSVAGYSKFGTYTGNGSTNGPIVETGFEPAFLIVKRTNNAGGWSMYDNKRNLTNPRNLVLEAESSLAEYSYADIDFLSNGFQIKGTNSGVNANGDTFLYMAFAADPSTAPALPDSFANKLYTGTGSTQSITGLGFSPNYVWMKQTTFVDNHYNMDSVRGAAFRIHSNLTAAQNGPDTNRFTSFDTDGFTIGSDPSVNQSGSGFVTWNWKANPVPTINTDGTIQSIVSANQAAGFSIVKYTGNGVNASTVGHGLSSEPEVIIIKSTTFASFWAVYNKYNTGSSGNPETEYVRLNSTNATATTSVYWGNTAPTSSVFSIGTDTDVNKSGETNIAYCFTSISGFSKMGSYSGTGSSNPITGLGFSPNWVMIKSSTSIENWAIFDTSRGENVLYANASDAESAFSPFTFDSDGFTVPAASGMTNGSGQTYIYMAYKENPGAPAAIPAGEVAYLVIAAGGGAGGVGGGGGAGGLRTSYGNYTGGGQSAESNITLSAQTYTITIGAGGTASATGGAFNNDGNTGSNGTSSVFGTITSLGGGGGTGGNNTALNGGSGGGSRYVNPGSGTYGQGFDGATGDIGGGGGGAGGAGLSSTAGSCGANGGPGLNVPITGATTFYAGGGAGGVSFASGCSASSGGIGGGGDAGANAGTANTGGGGGGGSWTNNANYTTQGGGNGGSGAVILRMNTSDYSGTTTGSPTVTTSGSETILTYTGSGTYVHS